jgi:hypothetical protein
MSMAEMIPQRERSGSNKFLVRMLVVLVVCGMLGGVLIFVLIKNSSPQKATTAKTTTTKDSSSTNTTKKTTRSATETTPKSLSLASISTIPIYTEDLTTVPNLLFPYLQKNYGTSGYYRVTIQDKRTNVYIGLRQFFNIYGITAPAGFYDATNDDFILFIYSNKGTNRLGFAANVKDSSALATAMNNWEGSMMQDTDNLFKKLGRKTQTPSGSMKFASSAGANQYRCLSFIPASDNFSLCYAVYNEKYFIFSTSAESIVNVFNQLPK